MLELTIEPPLATIALNDPDKRNAMSLPMFDAIDAAIAQIAGRDDVHIVLLHGHGPAFCAGFDLNAAMLDHTLLAQFILRLSRVNRLLRRLPQVVIAAVHGAAIAGGCAILSASDFIFVAPDAKLGYPVHRIGVSPAVTLPLLLPMLGNGAARALVMSGELIDGQAAHRLGLATHAAASSESVLTEARAHAQKLAKKGVNALRVTKRWLNELDHSLDDARFDPVANDSAEQTAHQETRELLASWKRPASS